MDGDLIKACVTTWDAEQLVIKAKDGGTEMGIETVRARFGMRLHE